jgi:5-oxoprolinase (ATP-hydrolysing)
MDVMQALFGQRNAAYRCAAGFSDSPHLFYSGFKPDGEFYLLYQIGFGGVPARPIGDGPDCHCLFPAIKSIPAENIELYFPVIIEANEALPDSGGAGFYRGGNAQRTLYRWLCEGDVSIHDDRWMIKPWGVNGGMPGSRSRKILYRNNSYGTERQKDNIELCQSKQDYLHVYPGKSTTCSTPYFSILTTSRRRSRMDHLGWRRPRRPPNPPCHHRRSRSSPPPRHCLWCCEELWCCRTLLRLFS